MSEDNQRLTERFSDLRALCAKKRFRLTKPEQEECIKVISDLIESRPENAEITVNSLPEFPSDVGSAVLAKNVDKTGHNEVAHFLDPQLTQIFRRAC